MKTRLTALTLATALTTISGQAAPIQVTGYNNDIIAEAGGGAITTVTSASVGVFTIAEAGYTGITIPATPIGTGLAITSDTVTTQNGTVFSVDADANNALTADGTLTLTTPGKYEDLQFLLLIQGGAFKVTVNFDDASTSVFEVTGLPDWQGASASNDAFAAKTTAPRRDNSTYWPNGLYLREVSFTLSPTDQLKEIDSLLIDFTATSNRGSVLGVSGTVVPEPGSLALLGLGGLLIARRRRG